MAAASETTTGRKSALKRGLALPPPSPGAAPGFPVTDAAHWDKAFQAVGRAGSPARRAALGKLLRRTAGKYGKSARVAGSWLDHSGDSPAIELVGKKGFEHGWRYVGGPGLPSSPPHHGLSTSARHRHASAQIASRLVSKTSGMSPEDQADAMSRRLKGGTGSVAQHRAAARLHRYAAQITSSPTISNYHTGMASMHEGIASRRLAHAKSSGSAISYANDGPAMEFAMPSARRLPVSSPSDLIVSRDPDGGARIRHRNGGAEIATLRNTDHGWVATLDGRALAPHTHQRGALAEAIGTWNRAAGTPQHRPAAAGEPLQPAPRQTPLMEQYGIPAIRALATPTTGSSDGPRATSAAGDDSSGPSGLSAKGQQIYKKLKAKGFPDARAMAFAKRAQSFGGGGS